MKHLMLLTLFVSFNSFAMSTGHTHCDAVTLSKDYQALELYLSYDGAFDDSVKLATNVSDKDGNKVEIQGLSINTLKVVKLDSFKKGHYGFGGSFTTFTNVYGVKFHISALVPIATEIQGCLPREINQIDSFAICYESRTISARE